MPRVALEDDDEYEDDEDDTIPCPHCQKQVYHDAEQCPYCGNYISEEDAPRDMKPKWIIIGCLICLAMTILWVWKG